jgi:peptide/nickel transport system substrate-binding protein
MEAKSYWQQSLARRISRRTALRSIAYGGAGIAAAALIGCGSRQKAASTTSGGPAGQPRSGGDLRMWLTADPFNFDVSIIGQSGPNSSSNDLAYETLLGFQYGDDPYSTKLVGKLAQSWETPDAQTYTFHLRPGVKFANLPPVGGRDVTSADWQFSLEYASRLGPQFSKLRPGVYAWLMSGVDKVDAPDANTVVVHFKDPFAPFLNYAAGERLQLLPHEIFDQYGNFQDHMVGTGPFQLDQASSQKGSKWVFKKNPTYWDTGKPYLNQITKLIIPDNQTAYAAFQTGQLDVLAGGGGATALAYQDVRTLKAANPNAVFKPNVNLNPYHMYINEGNPPTNNVAVRRAMSLAMDRNELIQTFTNGQGLWAIPGAFPDTFSQDEIKKMTYLKYDVQQAKQVLAAGGFPDGLDVEFLFNSAYGPVQQQLAELIQSQWQKAGIRMKITVMSDYNEYLARTRGGPGENYQLTIRGKSLEPDIDSYLYMVWDPNGGIEGQPCPYDPNLTPLIEKQRTMVDAAARRDVIRQAVAYIADTCWHLAPFRDVSYSVYHPNVQNLKNVWGQPDWPKETWLSA